MAVLNSQLNQDFVGLNEQLFYFTLFMFKIENYLIQANLKNY